jgi:hypothetical protein
LSAFLNAVVRRLEDGGIAGTLLHEEWATIVEADEEERQFCEVAAMLGLDPYSLEPHTQDLILSTSARLPEGLARDFFAYASPAVLDAQADSLLSAVAAARSNPADLHRFKTLRAALVSVKQVAAAPWEEGYRVARELRSRLGLNGTPLPSFAELSAALGVDESEIERAIREGRQGDSFDALVDVNERESPGFVITPRGDAARRFAFCRGLFEYLTSPPGSPSLVTHARSERQKRNRAFAAELLAPSSLLRERVSRSVIDDDEVLALAEDLNVSSRVIAHQLENHGIARILPD